MDFGLYVLGLGAQGFAQLPGANIQSLDLSQPGIWALIAQVLLAFVILERRMLKELLFGKASEVHLRRWKLRQAGFRQHAAMAGLATAWILAGFLA
jgi:hypothetical protein